MCRMHREEWYRRNRREFYAKHYPKNGVGIEIGVHRGDNLEDLMQATEARCVYAVDPWEPDGTYNDDRGEDLEAFTSRSKDWPCKVITLQATSQEAAHVLRDYEFDWVYIDARHDYDSVIKDLELWAPKATRLVGLHDYDPIHPDVIQACQDFFGREPDARQRHSSDALYLKENTCPPTST